MSRRCQTRSDEERHSPDRRGHPDRL